VSLPAPIGAGTLLAAWERGLAEGPVGRPLALLETALGEPPGRLASLPLGERDRRLAELRRHVLGGSADAETRCPACGERLEFALDLDVLEAAAGSPPPDARFTATVGEWRVAFRLPNTADLLAAGALGDEAGAGRAVVERCVLEAWDEGDREIAATELPTPVLEILAERMADADPRLNEVLDLDCPACGHRWGEAFDLGTYFWSELSAWAARLLHEVHVIASGYGWSEEAILALAPTRRRYYLERLLG
jgi:hypothetical protein